MSNLPELEVFLRADPLEAVAVSDPPVNVEQPIFQTVNLDGVLTDDDIGVTVQGFDVDTVIDSEYGDLKAKVNTIEEGAQVNPDLSLYAPKSNAVFTDSLTLPNNSRINNIEHFYQTTKPTTRGDGSALVIGDRWWKPSDNGIAGTAGDWIWTGSDWVTSYSVFVGWNPGNATRTFTLANGAVFGDASNAGVSALVPILRFGNIVYVDTWTVRLISVTSFNLDGSNSFQLQGGLLSVASTSSPIVTVDNITKLGGSSFGATYKVAQLRQLYGTGNGNLFSCLFVQSVVGAPSLTATCIYSWQLRGVHP